MTFHSLSDWFKKPDKWGIDDTICWSQFECFKKRLKSFWDEFKSKNRHVCLNIKISTVSSVTISAWPRKQSFIELIINKTFLLFRAYTSTQFVCSCKIIFYISYKFYTIIKQSGAVEACWAHNPEVSGSKPFSAMYFRYYSITPNYLFLSSCGTFICQEQCKLQILFKKIEVWF